MRLSKEYITAIKTTVETLDPDAIIYLFGSRADETKRGGDIDLLVFSKKIGPEAKWGIIRALHEILGEQKIDILIATDKKKPFVRIALETSVKL